MRHGVVTLIGLMLMTITVFATTTRSLVDPMWLLWAANSYIIGLVLFVVNYNKLTTEA